MVCEVINGFYSLFDFSFPYTSANLKQLLLPQPSFSASLHVLVSKHFRHDSYADMLCEWAGVCLTAVAMDQGCAFYFLSYHPKD